VVTIAAGGTKGKAWPNNNARCAGWTTGACAAAAAKGRFRRAGDRRVSRSGRSDVARAASGPSFALAMSRNDGDGAIAGIVKDAGGRFPMSPTAL